MSRMLSLFASGFDAATAHATAGHTSRARNLFDALLRSPTLSTDEVVRTRLAAARLAFTAERYKLARKHLTIAVRLAPGDAALHHALGRAFEDDPYGCDRRAAWRFRQACRLKPDNPLYHAAFGRSLVRIGTVKKGVRLLHQAAADAPTDVAVLAVVADGLREAGRAADAVRILVRARFQDQSNARIRQLWERARFDVSAEGQRRAGARSRDDERILKMPALKIVPAEPNRVRRDAGGVPAPHAHLGRFKTYSSDLG